MVVFKGVEFWQNITRVRDCPTLKRFKKVIDSRHYKRECMSLISYHTWYTSSIVFVE